MPFTSEEIQDDFTETTCEYIRRIEAEARWSSRLISSNRQKVAAWRASHPQKFRSYRTEYNRRAEVRSRERKRRLAKSQEYVCIECSSPGRDRPGIRCRPCASRYANQQRWLHNPPKGIDRKKAQARSLVYQRQPHVRSKRSEQAKARRRCVVRVPCYICGKPGSLPGSKCHACVAKIRWGKLMEIIQQGCV